VESGVEFVAVDNQRVAKLAGESLKAAADQFVANVLPVIREIQSNGTTRANAIAAKLNERWVKTTYIQLHMPCSAMMSKSGRSFRDASSPKELSSSVAPEWQALDKDSACATCAGLKSVPSQPP
jgi:hypothetical protein